MTHTHHEIVMDGGTTVWCTDGHDPKLIDERHSDSGNQACPECGNEFSVSVSIKQVTADE